MAEVFRSMEEAASFINARSSIARFFEPVETAPYAKWAPGEPGGRGGQFAGKATVAGKWGAERRRARAERASEDLGISLEEAFRTPDEELAQRYREADLDPDQFWGASP